MNFITPMPRVTPPDPPKVDLTPKPLNLNTGFDPSANGFAFDNSFENDVVGVIGAWSGLPLPNLGITTDGLCGGMSYAALDYYLTGSPVPRLLTEKPKPDSPPNARILWKYLLDRQFDSYPYVGSRIVRDYAVPFFFQSAEDEFDRALKKDVYVVRDHLVRRRPIPLCLVNDTFGLTNHHQVLAYGMFMPREDQPAGVRIVVYDPNQPGMVALVYKDPGSKKFMLTGRGTRYKTIIADTGYDRKFPPILPEFTPGTPGGSGRVIATPGVGGKKPGPITAPKLLPQDVIAKPGVGVDFRKPNPFVRRFP